MLISHYSSWKSFCRSNGLPIKLWLNHLCSVEDALSSSNTFSSSKNANTESHCACCACLIVIFFFFTEGHWKTKHSFSSLDLSSVYSMDSSSISTLLFKAECSLTHWTVSVAKWGRLSSLQLKCNKCQQLAVTWLLIYGKHHQQPKSLLFVCIYRRFKEIFTMRIVLAQNLDLIGYICTF